MSDLDHEIRELTEKTAQIRYQFLSAEIQTCSISLEMAQFALSVGDIAMARREIAATESGILDIERFLPAVVDERRPELEQKLAALKTALASATRENEKKFGVS